MGLLSKAKTLVAKSFNSCKSKISSLFGNSDSKNNFNFDSIDIGESNIFRTNKDEVPQYQQGDDSMEISSKSFAKLDSPDLFKNYNYSNPPKTIPTSQLSSLNVKSSFLGKYKKNCLKLKLIFICI